MSIEKSQAETEQARDLAEKSQAEAEQARDLAEKSRAEAEQARDLAEKSQAEAEQARGDAEKSQAEAEKARGDAEKSQAEAEKARGDAEKSQVEAEQARDVTVEALGRAEKAREEAEQANLTKSYFLANMSHEIRTPITAIVGYAQLLQHIIQNEAEKNKCIDAINRNSQCLMQIIDDILELSKIETNSIQIRPQPFHLVKELFSIVAPFRTIAHKKSLKLGLTIEDTVPKLIHSDPGRIRQILNNLLNNAIKFTPQGGRVDVNVGVGNDRCSGTKSIICVRVRDTGIGISKDDKEFLFNIFSQADPSITRKYGGSGLGLVIAKRLAVLLGGDVVLTDSVKNQGSTFTAFFVCRRLDPLRSTNEVIVREQNTHKNTTGPAKLSLLERMTILLVEDSKDIEALFVQILKENGAKVESAEDGLEAINKALNGSFDLVLMDIQMPNMGGYEATKILRQHNYTGPIVALTARVMSEEKTNAIDSGCNDCISKPTNINSFLAYVSRYKPVS